MKPKENQVNLTALTQECDVKVVAFRTGQAGHTLVVVPKNPKDETFTRELCRKIGSIPVRLVTLKSAEAQPAPTRRRRRKRRRKCCPFKGCRHTFAPRFGGYCTEHRSSPEYKKWAKSARSRDRRSSQ